MQKVFELGQRLRDTVSDFEGIATSRITFMNGCTRYALEPKIDKEGKSIEGIYFDSQQLELVNDGLLKKTQEAKTNTGGVPVRTIKQDRILR